jgi:1-acyl-sn-glycerol-3-phosphate acyltransferase
VTSEFNFEDYVRRQHGYELRRRIFHIGVRGLFYLLTRYKVYNKANVPQTGPLILMINHTDYIDPGAALAAVDRTTVVVAKVETLDNAFFRPFIKMIDAITVNRGEADRRALTAMIRALEAGYSLVMSPEGTRNPAGLQQPREGLVYLATRTNATVIPAAISDVRDWNKLLFKGMRGWATVTFGQPFRFKTGGQRRVPREQMEIMMREAMYQLAITLPDPLIRGIYSDIENATTDTLEFVDPRTGQPLPEPAAVIR